MNKRPQDRLKLATKIAICDLEIFSIEKLQTMGFASELKASLIRKAGNKKKFLK